jgi:hypothetical protein
LPAHPRPSAGRCGSCGGPLKLRRSRPVPSAFIIRRRLYDCIGCGKSTITAEQFECFTLKRCPDLEWIPDAAEGELAALRAAVGVRA